jgi:hypothetical protein
LKNDIFPVCSCFLVATLVSMFCHLIVLDQSERERRAYQVISGRPASHPTGYSLIDFPIAKLQLKVFGSHLQSSSALLQPYLCPEHSYRKTEERMFQLMLCPLFQYWGRKVGIERPKPA